MNKKPTEVQKKKERDPQKMKRVLQRMGYSNGKVPVGYEVHHVKPVSEGGKTTRQNLRIVPKGKHKQIHKNRRKRGQT